MLSANMIAVLTRPVGPVFILRAQKGPGQLHQFPGAVAAAQSPRPKRIER